jgi:hypothetical protein
VPPSAQASHALVAVMLVKPLFLLVAGYCRLKMSRHPGAGAAHAGCAAVAAIATTAPIAAVRRRDLRDLSGRDRETRLAA